MKFIDEARIEVHSGKGGNGAGVDPEGQPLTFSWAFGDGGTASGATATHAYSAANTYMATLTVGDGQLSATTSFVLTVSTSFTATIMATNTTPIVIPDIGLASPYPSVINVSGLAGTITNLSVTLNNLSHTWAADMDILLVGPTGEKVMIFKLRRRKNSKRLRGHRQAYTEIEVTGIAGA